MRVVVLVNDIYKIVNSLKKSLFKKNIHSDRINFKIHENNDLVLTNTDSWIVTQAKLRYNEDFSQVSEGESYTVDINELLKCLRKSKTKEEMMMLDFDSKTLKLTYSDYSSFELQLSGIDYPNMDILFNKETTNSGRELKINPKLLESALKVFSLNDIDFISVSRMKDKEYLFLTGGDFRQIIAGLRVEEKPR